MFVCILSQALLSVPFKLSDINLIGRVCNYCRPIMIYRSEHGYEILGEVIIRLSFRTGWLASTFDINGVPFKAPLHTQCSSSSRRRSLPVCHYPIDSRVGRSFRSHTEAVSDDDYTKGNEKNVIKVAPLISPEICSANSHPYFGL